MSRPLTVAAMAFVAVSSLVVWTHEVYALTTATRICVANARRNRRNLLNTYRAQAQVDYQNQLRTCFTDPQYQCVSACQTGLDLCQKGDSRVPDSVKNSPIGRRDFCTKDETANDGHESCLERFDADQDGCAAIPPTGDPIQDANKQIMCAQNARIARFNCDQGCVAAVQRELDSCNQVYSDCLERAQGCR